MNVLLLAAMFLCLASSVSAALLLRDVSVGRLRERVGAVRVRDAEPEPPTRVRILAVRSPSQRSDRVACFMRFLRFNPEIAYQNIIAWKFVFGIAGTVALIGFFYGRALVGWPLAMVLTPIEGLFLTRFIFGWERGRFQKAMLEQVPDVMAMICRAVSAGIPLSEALRSVAKDAPSPSREEFTNVVNDMAVGQPIEHGLWKLYERVGLAEYAFFAVTIGLQAQTGGNLVETLENLQDMVRKRVALSKRGKALAAEARMSAIILAALPGVICIILYFLRPGFIGFFFYTPTGNRLALVTFGLMSVGIMTMRQLIRRSLAP